MSGELWKPAPKSAGVKAMYDLAEEQRRKDPARFELSVDRLMESARRNMGLSDFNGDEFIPAFERLVDSMNREAGLNAVGLKAAKGLVRTPLEQRLKMEELFAARPGLSEIEVRRPIFITGGSRTGTTLLQRLLAVDPGNRALLSWEMTSPASLGSDDQKAIADAVNKAQAAHDGLHFLNPGMKTVHFSGATVPEECVLMMGTDGLNWGIISNMYLPSYSEFLFGQDFTSAYLRHKRLLQIFQHGRTDVRWVLKAPYHLPELSSLLKAYPGACIIHTHRDMVETIASTASLFCTFRSTFSDRVDPAGAGREQVELLGRWTERAERAKASLPKDSPARIFDVRFRDLVADPMGTVGKIYERLDVELTREAADLMGEHLKKDRAKKEGGHRYTPAQFGLDPDEIYERFASYSGRYGI